MNRTRRKALAFPVIPKEYDSLVGLLMRASEENMLPGPYSILVEVIGKATKPPEPKHIIPLSEVLGCNPSALQELLGFTYRYEGGRRWRLAGHWITKEYFLRSRSMAVCPACLKEEAILKATWELTPYVACSRHGNRLIDACPECKGPLRWLRASVTTCPCGFNLATATAQSADPTELFLAWLIDSTVGFKSICRGATVPIGVFSWLCSLSLDEILRSVWFLGHCLESCNTGSGHGRRKGGIEYAAKMVRTWHSILEDWPKGFVDQLARIGDQKLARTSRGLLERTFGPVQSYATQELDGNLEYLRRAYKQFILHRWRHHLAPPRSLFGGQQELFLV